MNLQELMRKAIGGRSVAEFSNLCGISAKDLSDCIHGRYSSFTVTEIARIAGNAYNGVTYTELLEYFGFDEPVEYTVKNMMTTTELFTKVVKFYFECLPTSDIRFNKDNDYQILNDIVEQIAVYYPKFEQEDKPDFGIDNYWTNDTTMIVQLSWVDHGFTVSWEFGIIISDESKISSMLFSREELYRYGSNLAGHQLNSEGFEDILGYDYAIEFIVPLGKHENILKQFTVEEELLSRVFGESTQPRTIEGYGFDLPCEERLRKFCKTHTDSISSVSDDTLDMYDSRRFGYVVSNIIYTETGIKVYPYHTSDTRCIMYPTKLPWDMSEYEKYITKKHLYSVLDKYARELGTTVKKCYILTKKKYESEFDDLDNI